MRPLRVIYMEGCEVGHFTGVEAALLAEVAAGAPAALLIAELSGDTVVLGRFQRALSALTAIPRPVARRLGGGRTLLAGQGRLGLALALPPAGLFDQPLLPAKLINRYVRGLLRGLGLAGAAEGAFYFGRDFVTADHRQLAVVSQDGLRGATLFEAYLATTRSLALPSGWSAYPRHSDARAAGPAAITLAELWERPRSFAELADTLARAYAASHDCELIRAEPPAPAPAPPWQDAVTLPASSGLVEAPIGFLEARVLCLGDRIEAARLHGDFIAPAEVVEAAERALCGAVADAPAALAAVFARPDAALLGTTPAALASAVLAAARAPHLPGPTSAT